MDENKPETTDVELPEIDLQVSSFHRLDTTEIELTA